MRFHATKIRTPQWSSADRSGILCWVKFAEFDEELPFHAMPTDPEEHGRDIYNRLIGGEAGPIAEYNPPPKPKPTAPQEGPRVIA